MLMEHLLQLVNKVSAKTRCYVFPGNEACNAGTSDVGHNLSKFVKTTEQCMGRTFTKTRREMVKKNKKQQISAQFTHAGNCGQSPRLDRPHSKPQ
jgi:hypothetical protein